MADVSVNGVRLFYRFDGPADAPVLVMSNSLGTTHGLWEPQMAELARHFRVLRYDKRGHGASEVAPGPYTMAQLGGDVVGLLDELGIGRAHFCGLSVGGMTGMWLGVNAPDRFDRLVLCNTAPFAGGPELWQQRIEGVEAGGMAAVLEGVLERWFTPGYLERAAGGGQPAADVVARARAMLAECPAQGYAGVCAAIRDMDQREAIAAIRNPTLIIAGEADQATPLEQSHFMAERIEGSRLVTLPAAHLSNLECPEAFTGAVLDFLNG